MAFVPAKPDETADKSRPTAPKPGEATYRAGITATYRDEKQKPGKR